jgi:neutral ceramidase
VTGKEFEDTRGPDTGGPHGDKATFPGLGAGVPHGVPLISIRVGTRMIASIPGEATKQVGTRIRSAVRSSVAGSGIKDVVLSGLANEFILYITTPEEYDRQHYEGGNTQFGRQESNLIKQEVAGLAGRLARGQAAPDPYPYDPTNGVQPNGPAYGPGAASGSFTAQPAGAYGRLQRATVGWSGGASGLDRPVDRAFVTAQRRKGKRWISVDDDRGLDMLWHVDPMGRYDAQWEIPRFATRGTYRLVVTAKRYRLISRTFKVVASPVLTVRPITAPAGRATVALAYPTARENVDLTYRPRYASAGTVKFKVGSKTVTAKRKHGIYFTVRAPAGTPVTVPAGAAKDAYGNTNRGGVSVR